ncbi:metal cation symporter ZIP14 isoform X2 [Patella vulgata]|uniref:metal cation symporter ZIP14 isoform X2 n=1 Tax=Patella vulgata TaxID=6465 RepID=UPI0024A7ADFA|nr:metal cation symporter ZIP14 isoform X2 [Patella vulgata]
MAPSAPFRIFFRIVSVTSKSFLISILLLISLLDHSWQFNETNSFLVNEVFIKQLTEKYRTNNSKSLDFSEFSQFYSDLVGHEISVDFSVESKNLTDCLDKIDEADISQCLLSKIGKSCISPYDLYEVYSLPTTNKLSIDNLTDISIGVLLSIQQKRCLSYRSHLHLSHPTSTAVWGYSFLCVTLINLCSLVGIIVLPFMKMVIYKILLIFMVALAVGSLAGSGLLFLIPEAFGLAAEGDTSYILKSTTVIGGIYLFYLTERIMKMLMQWRESKKRSKEDLDEDKKDIFCSVRCRTPLKSESEMKDPAHIPSSNSACTQVTLLNHDISEGDLAGLDVVKVANGNGDSSINNHSKSNGTHRHHRGDYKHPIATVAYMIIFGDGLHNFIDGLSIGAAFTNSILSGVSVSMACICEELPHELGDFAILLNSGMSLRKALLYNFLSACMCYLGLIVGVLLGENTTAHEWVFAIAGGMFLYISLVDMVTRCIRF